MTLEKIIEATGGIVGVIGKIAKELFGELVEGVLGIADRIYRKSIKAKKDDKFNSCATEVFFNQAYATFTDTEHFRTYLNNILLDLENQIQNDLSLSVRYRKKLKRSKNSLSLLWPIDIYEKDKLITTRLQKCKTFNEKQYEAYQSDMIQLCENIYNYVITEKWRLEVDEQNKIAISFLINEIRKEFDKNNQRLEHIFGLLSQAIKDGQVDNICLRSINEIVQSEKSTNKNMVEENFAQNYLQFVDKENAEESISYNIKDKSDGGEILYSILDTTEEVSFIILLTSFISWIACWVILASIWRWNWAILREIQAPAWGVFIIICALVSILSGIVRFISGLLMLKMDSVTAFRIFSMALSGIISIGLVIGNYIIFFII